MYGYIKPNIPELKVKEKLRYDAWYCGLCRALGKRYGQASRMLLSYDASFLALLLSCAMGLNCSLEKHKCPVRPLGKKKVMVCADDPALDYAADACVILAKFKIKDDVMDGQKLHAAFNLPFIHAFNKAKRSAPKTHECVENGINRLVEIEMNKEPSADIAANAFGDILRGIIENAPQDMTASEKEREQMACVLSELGFFIGRTVYLLDAWDDREKDKKRGLYNPFNLANTSKEDAEFMVNISINSAISAYDLLERCVQNAPKGDLSIIRNIMSEGLFASWDNMKDGRAKKQKQERLDKVE